MALLNESSELENNMKEEESPWFSTRLYKLWILELISGLKA